MHLLVASLAGVNNDKYATVITWR